MEHEIGHCWRCKNLVGACTCHEKPRWDSIKAWANDGKNGHGTTGWNTRRFSVISKSGEDSYYGVTVNEIMNFVILKLKDVDDYRVETH